MSVILLQKDYARENNNILNRHQILRLCHLTIKMANTVTVYKNHDVTCLIRRIACYSNETSMVTKQ